MNENDKKFVEIFNDEAKVKELEGAKNKEDFKEALLKFGLTVDDSEAEQYLASLVEFSEKADENGELTEEMLEDISGGYGLDFWWTLGTTIYKTGKAAWNAGKKLGEWYLKHC